SRGTRTYNAPPTTGTAPTQAGGLLMGGFLGAGLFGLLTGAGLFGGLTGFTSFLGLLIQVALMVGVAYLAVGYFRSRQQAALARAQAGAGGLTGRTALDGALAGAGTPAATGGTIAIGAADYDAFERLLGDIQTAYGREDVDALGDMATPEMLS